MDLFLLHSLILIWASIGAARRLTPGLADRLLAAGLLAWGNLVATCLLLSLVHGLDEPGWFLCLSTALALLVCLLPPNPTEDRASSVAGDLNSARINPWLLGAFVLTILPVAGANLAVAYTYLPNNSDSLTYHLPRALYYLGQGNLAHFDAADPRQIFLPFDYNLLQIFAFIYDPPLQCLNAFNVAAWALSGIAVFRFCRLCACSANASLIASWLVLTATPLVARATITTPELSAGAALLGAMVFVLRWRQTHQLHDAMLAGLALGLATGSDLGILLFVFLAGLLLLVWKLRRAPESFRAVVRAWVFPMMLVGAMSLPFALINLRETGGLISLDLIRGHPLRLADLGQIIWQMVAPLVRAPTTLAVLNEDNAGLGLLGPAFIICAIFWMRRSRGPAGFIPTFAWLGLGWICLSLFHWGPDAGLHDVVPAILLLGPCVAASIDFCRECRPTVRTTGIVIALMVIFTTGWSGGIYLLKNTSRPLAPLFGSDFVPPAFPPLPLLVEHHLSKHSRINIDTDGINERIFLLMVSHQGQSFTSRHQIDPEVYNLVSRSSLSHNAPCEDLNRLSSYLVMPIPHKRTAGVEFLATLGQDLKTWDYFGIEPHAGNIPPVDSSQFILITLSAAPHHFPHKDEICVKVAGLNPVDQVRLDVTVENIDRSTKPLTTFTAAGEKTLLIEQPFYSLTFKAVDATTGGEISATEVRARFNTSLKLPSMDRSLPSNGRSLFVTDLVTFRESSVIASEGFLPTEGPFPQWDLPLIRWAKRASISLTIPSVPEMVSLQLSFSVRLHSRARGELEVLFNGKSVQHYRIEGRTTWLNQTLEFKPQPGANVLEFRDVPVGSEPDWRAYLERYPDVMNYLVSNNIPLEQGAQEHYESNGRAEGRILPTTGKPEPVPDSYYFMFRNIRLEGFKSP